MLSAVIVATQAVAEYLLAIDRMATQTFDLCELLHLSRPHRASADVVATAPRHMRGASRRGLVVSPATLARGEVVDLVLVHADHPFRAWVSFPDCPNDSARRVWRDLCRARRSWCQQAPCRLYGWSGRDYGTNRCSIGRTFVTRAMLLASHIARLRP